LLSFLFAFSDAKFLKKTSQKISFFSSIKIKCNPQDYRECVDAEGLMPLPLTSSDINKTISMEMRMAKTINILNLCHGNHTAVSNATTAPTTKSSSFVTPPENIGPNKFIFPSIDAAVVRNIPTTNLRDTKNSSLNSKHSISAIAVTATKDVDVINASSTNNVHSSTNADIASVDSTDTFMSCQTHPFLSQGDLNIDDNDMCDFDMIDADVSFYSTNNIMLQQQQQQQQRARRGQTNSVLDSSLTAPAVKKSTSGDTALRSLVTSPIEDQYQAFVAADRGSRVSLNETPVPKHRKTRFQQQVNSSGKLRTRFDDENEIENASEANMSSEYSNSSSNNNNKKNRRASFMPSKIITTATKQLINQHLFGLQSTGSKGNISFCMQ
jgi:hypothetical protein